jgi:endogenous inhibitor of DNA gyrase (YacG/DUF329 family)
MSDTDTCPDAKKFHHPDMPDGYIERADWMKRMGKTHVQRRCPTCRRFFVWSKKKPCARCGRLIVNESLHTRRWHGRAAR